MARIAVGIIFSCFFFTTVQCQPESKKKALIVATSVEKYANIDRATGLWLGEAVHFYEVMDKAGITVDLCSPRGGYIPIEPESLQVFNVPADWKYYGDPKFRAKLGSSITPEQVKVEDYNIIYFAGGHGTMWDFRDNPKLQEIARKIYETNGIVSSVCHGAVALLNIKLSNGEFLIKGKRVTGFSNKEEAYMNLTNVVPFLPEDELKKRGAIYLQVKKDKFPDRRICLSRNRLKAPQIFTDFSVTDGRLVTGQNPLSGGSVGKKVLQALANKWN